MTDDPRQGQPGQPGKPGEPGKPSGIGGHGGAGGEGGRGGRARESHHLYIVMLVGLLFAVTLSTGTLILVTRVESNSDSISRLQAENAIQTQQANARQDRAIVAARKAEYRICLRQQITRAALALDKNNDEPRLALYDCTPDLEGGEARLLTPKERRRFLHYVLTGKHVP